MNLQDTSVPFPYGTAHLWSIGGDEPCAVLVLREACTYVTNALQQALLSLVAEELAELWYGGYCENRLG